MRAGSSPDPKVFVRVVSFDDQHGFANIRIWDIPNGCLRKEDSRPEVYFIQNGKKHHIVSPEVLLAIGQSWSDVKEVPDGSLSILPTDTPITLKDVSECSNLKNKLASLKANLASLQSALITIPSGGKGTILSQIKAVKSEITSVQKKMSLIGCK